MLIGRLGAVSWPWACILLQSDSFPPTSTACPSSSRPSLSRAFTFSLSSRRIRVPAHASELHLHAGSPTECPPRPQRLTLYDRHANAARKQVLDAPASHHQRASPVCRSWPLYAAAPWPRFSSALRRSAARPQRYQAAPAASRPRPSRCRRQLPSSLQRCLPSRKRRTKLRPRGQSPPRPSFCRTMTTLPGLLSEAASCPRYVDRSTRCENLGTEHIAN